MRGLAGLVAALLLSACAGPASPPPNASLPPETSTLVETLNGFSWSSQGVEGSFGIVARLQVVEPAACEFTGGFTREAGASDLSSVFVVQGDGIEAWSVSSDVRPAHAHVEGLLDTRERRDEDGGVEARRTDVEVPAAHGEILLMLLAEDVRHWENDLLDGANVLLEARCDAGVALSEFLGTREFAMADIYSASGGAGAHLQPGASLSLLDGVNATAHGEHGFFLWGSVGGAGLVTLDHPTGSLRWTIEDAATQTFLGNPGNYEAKIERVGADFDYFFAALAGVESFPTGEEARAWAESGQVQDG